LKSCDDVLHGRRDGKKICSPQRVEQRRCHCGRHPSQSLLKKQRKMDPF